MPAACVKFHTSGGRDPIGGTAEIITKIEITETVTV
jgi:hypothetical protein